MVALIAAFGIDIATAGAVTSLISCRCRYRRINDACITVCLGIPGRSALIIIHATDINGVGAAWQIRRTRGRRGINDCRGWNRGCRRRLARHIPSHGAQRSGSDCYGSDFAIVPVVIIIVIIIVTIPSSLVLLRGLLPRLRPVRGSSCWRVPVRAVRPSWRSSTF